MVVPVHHVPIMIRAHMVVSGLISQAGPLILNIFKKLLINPYVGSNIQIHTIVAATIGITEGKKKIVLTIPLPRNLLLTILANISATSRFTGVATKA